MFRNIVEIIIIKEYDFMEIRPSRPMSVASTGTHSTVSPPEFKCADHWSAQTTYGSSSILTTPYTVFVI